MGYITLSQLTVKQRKEIADHSLENIADETIKTFNVRLHTLRACRKEFGCFGRSKKKKLKPNMKKAITDVKDGATPGAAAKANRVTLDNLLQEIDKIKEKSLSGMPKCLLPMAQAVGFFIWKDAEREGMAA